jgi:hypothetical protein
MVVNAGREELPEEPPHLLFLRSEARNSISSALHIFSSALLPYFCACLVLHPPLTQT